MTTSDETRWLNASAVGEAGLTHEQVSSWREAGYALVRGLIPRTLIDESLSQAHDHFPSAGSEAASKIRDFGSNMVFPHQIDALNEITLHPRLLGAVAQLLDTNVTNLRLSQSDVWAKYGRPDGVRNRYDNSDQRIHVDYPNHMLAHPTEWHRPEAVEIIIYYSDVDACGGPTAVVPRSGATDPAYRWPIVDSPGIAGKPFVNDRTEAEADLERRDPEVASWRKTLYERERYVAYEPGDVLLYRHDTWHRGTPMHDDALRVVHNLTFRRAECEWISTLHVGWAWSAYRQPGYLEQLIARLSLDQRAVLGFPQPGSSYWTEATIAAVEARHVGMDMSPYREGL